MTAMTFIPMMTPIVCFLSRLGVNATQLVSILTIFMCFLSAPYLSDLHAYRKLTITATQLMSSLKHMSLLS